MGLNKVTAAIAAASTVLIATMGFFIYRDIKHTRQINTLTKQQNILQTNLDNLTKQQNNLEANLDDKIIDISVKITSKSMEIQKIENNKKFSKLYKAYKKNSKLRKAYKNGFDRILHLFNYIGIDITKSTPEEFYDSNKEKLGPICELLKNNHTPQKENTLGTNGTKDNKTAPKLNKQKK